MARIQTSATKIDYIFHRANQFVDNEIKPTISVAVINEKIKYFLFFFFISQSLEVGTGLLIKSLH